VVGGDEHENVWPLRNPLKKKLQEIIKKYRGIELKKN
jgi:hypothetical protein